MKCLQNIYRQNSILRGTSSRCPRHCPGLQNSDLSCPCLFPTPCGHLPLIDFGLFPNSSVGQRREQTSFSCIIDQPCVSPLSIKQSFILPTNDYICIYSTLEDDRRMYQDLGMSHLSFQPSFSFCAIPAFLEAKQVDNVQKSRPSHKFWIGNL